MCIVSKLKTAHRARLVSRNIFLMPRRDRATPPVKCGRTGLLGRASESKKLTIRHLCHRICRLFVAMIQSKNRWNLDEIGSLLACCTHTYIIYIYPKICQDFCEDFRSMLSFFLGALLCCLLTQNDKTAEEQAMWSGWVGIQL